MSAGRTCTIPAVMAPNSSSAPPPSGLCQQFAHQFAHAPTHEIRRQILCQREQSYSRKKRRKKKEKTQEQQFLLWQGSRAGPGPRGCNSANFTPAYADQNLAHQGLLELNAQDKENI